MSLTLIAVLFANLVWGLSPILAKVGLQQVDELGFLLFRFGLSTLFFLPIVLKAAKKVGRIKITHLLVGVLTVSVHYYLQVFALKQAPVTWYVFFYSLCPILSLLAVRVNWSTQLLIVGFFAVVGTWVFVDFDAAQNISVLTLLALGASVITWVLFTASIRSWQATFSDVEISATTSALSFIVFGIIAFFHSESITEGWNVTAVSATVGLSILLPVAFFAYSYSLRKNPGLAVLGQYSEPVFGTLGAILILGETISMRQIAGLAIIVLALSCMMIPAAWFRSKGPLAERRN